MPRQPRRDPFRSSSGTFGPAPRPGSSTGTLHPVIVRGLEQRAGCRAARDRGDLVAPPTARAAARGHRGLAKCREECPDATYCVPHSGLARQLVAGLGLSLAQAARHLGVSTAAISKILRKQEWGVS